MKTFKKITAVSIVAGASLFATASLNQNNNAQASSFSNVYNVAQSKMGSPYSYGATGPNSFDCSGFTQYVYKKGAGVNLSRTAQSQYNSNQKVSTKNMQPGDLAFFGGSKSSISHVGLYVGNGKMIDAQNRGVVTENVHASWWHLVGASRPANSGYVSIPQASKPVSSVHYYNKKATKHIKNNNKYAIYNHVKGSGYTVRKNFSSKALRGMKVHVNKGATNNGKRYWRITANHHTLGWLNYHGLRK